MPPIHPYANIPEAHIQPVSSTSQEPAVTTASKGKEPAYRTIVPIQNPKTVDEIYNRAMKAVTISISNEELLLLSPELHQKHREQVTPKRITMTTSDDATTNVADIVPFADSNDSEFPIASTKQLSATPPASSTNASDTSYPVVNTFTYVLNNPYEQYLNRLAPGKTPEVLVVAKESHSLRMLDILIDNQEYIEAVVVPGSQIIAMSKAICHTLGLQYDPCIRLNMQSANRELNLSLGLSHNVPTRIGHMTMYVQIHVIRAPTYDILLGRPFDVLTASIVKNFRNKDQTITIDDPNTGEVATIPTRPRGKPCYHLPLNYPHDITAVNFRKASRN
jgi:hypothetical protein